MTAFTIPNRVPHVKLSALHHPVTFSVDYFFLSTATSSSIILLHIQMFCFLPTQLSVPFLFWSSALFSPTWLLQGGLLVGIIKRFKIGWFTTIETKVSTLSNTRPPNICQYCPDGKCTDLFSRCGICIQFWGTQLLHNAILSASSRHTLLANSSFKWILSLELICKGQSYIL